ncbi:hypothetical protein BKI52_15325 [marine bacterium AO1-C]|nr:hypothetical protein BKI52_15325 [marine bacterium AO1-C]
MATDQQHSDSGDNVGNNKNTTHQRGENIFNVKGNYHAPSNSGGDSIPKHLTAHIPSLAPNDVIGREEKLQELTDTLNTSYKAIVVNGLGGIGKSTLAKLYLVTHRDSFAHITWLTFTGKSFTEMILNSALPESLGIVRTGRTPEDLLKLVFSTLRELEGHKLLVIDNADNIEEIEAHRSLLPLGDPYWKVLITSRRTLPNMETVRIDKLSPESATQLFLRHYPEGVNEPQNLQALLEEVDYHTLTVELMAKTLQESWELTLEQMLQKVRNTELTDESLKEQIWTAHQQNYKEKLSEEVKAEVIGMYSHLKACFDLGTLDKNEQWMLKQFAVLPPMVEMDGKVLIEWLTSEAENVPKKKDYKSFMKSLADKGWLITRPEKKAVFQLHPVIKSLVLVELSPSFADCKDLMNGFNKFIHIDTTTQDIVGKFGWVGYGEELTKVFGADNAQGHQPTSFDEMKTIAALYFNLGWVYKQQGNYQDALIRHKIAFDFTQAWKLKQSDNNEANTKAFDILVANYQGHVGLAYSYLGNYEKAKELLEKTFESDLKNFDEDHPEIGGTLGNLGIVYKNLGQLEKAKDLLEKALTIALKNFEESHPAITICQSNLATVYQDLGAYEKAKDLLEKALEDDIKNFEESHPNTAIRQYFLASTYLNLEMNTEAQVLFQKAYETFYNLLGENHPKTKATKSWLNKYFS